MLGSAAGATPRDRRGTSLAVRRRGCPRRALADDGGLAWRCNAARTRRHPKRAEARPELFPRGVSGTAAALGRVVRAGDRWRAFHLADRGAVATASTTRRRWPPASGRLLGRDAEAAPSLSSAAGALDLAHRVPRRRRHPRAGGPRPSTCGPLAFDPCPTPLGLPSPPDWSRLIRFGGTHLGTGFLATPDLLLRCSPTPATSDVAYELLFQDTPPSWLVHGRRGPRRSGSSGRNRRRRGGPTTRSTTTRRAVIDFCTAYWWHPPRADGDAGPDEVGCRRFRGAASPAAAPPGPRRHPRFAPRPHRPSWRLDGDELVLSVTVPPGTSAEVVLPDGRRRRRPRLVRAPQPPDLEPWVDRGGPSWVGALGARAAAVDGTPAVQVGLVTMAARGRRTCSAGPTCLGRRSPDESMAWTCGRREARRGGVQGDAHPHTERREVTGGMEGHRA